MQHRQSENSSIVGVFAVLLLNTMLGSFLQTTTSSLLPAIMGSLSIQADTAQWLNTANSLAMGMIIPASAFFVKRFRVRPLYAVSLLMNLLGTFMCGVGLSFPVMLLGRILQAVGSGMCMPLTQVLILTMFPENRRGTAMGIYGVASSLTPAFAPTLAGVIAERFGWQMVFYGSLAVYAVVLALALRFMRNVLPVTRQSFDLRSFMGCCIGFAGVTIGVGNLTSAGLISVQTLLPLGLGVKALVWFSRRQLHLPAPFLDVRVLGNSRCCWAVVSSMLLYGRLISVSTVTHLYQQVVRGLTPSVSGLIMMPGALVTALLSPIAGKCYDKYGPRKVLLTGAILQAVSAAGYCLVGHTTSVFYLTLLQIVQGASISFMLMPLVTWGMSSLGVQNTAHGTAIQSSLRTIAGGLGSALFTGILSSVSLTSTQTSVSLEGVRAAFLGMLALTLIQLAVAFFKLGKQTKKEGETP